MSCIAPGCSSPAEVGAVFCRKHLEAPAGKRGGWISAHKRRRMMGGGMEALNASNIARRLWVGGKPSFDRDLPQFDMLVLCAEELQPQRVSFHGQVVRCPLRDCYQLTELELERALAGGRRVAKALTEGQTVLVTCQMGWNRSALVAGLGLGLVTKMPADTIVTLLRARRSEDCFSNPHFVEILRRYVPGRRPSSVSGG